MRTTNHDRSKHGGRGDSSGQVQFSKINANVASALLKPNELSQCSKLFALLCKEIPFVMDRNQPQAIFLIEYGVAKAYAAMMETLIRVILSLPAPSGVCHVEHGCPSFISVSRSQATFLLLPSCFQGSLASTPRCPR